MLCSKTFFPVVVVCIAMLIGCVPKPISYETGATIAVWDLDNLSTFDGTRPDLGELLSAGVIETLMRKGTHSVVERERLLVALEELRLGTTSLVDESARLTLGRLVGAQLMVFGGYQIVEKMMRVDLRMVEVESGKVLKAVQKTTSATDLSGWLHAVSEAAAELL
jgi:curli biogenesis system outer membrane secretion channel CsgG